MEVDLCEDPYVAALLLVIGEVNMDVCDYREEGQNWEIIDVVINFVNIFLLKEILPMFGHIPFFTSAIVLMLLSSKYWQMYLWSARRVLGGGFGWVLPPTRFCSSPNLLIGGWGTRPPWFPEGSWGNHCRLNNRHIYLIVVTLLSTLWWVGKLQSCCATSTFHCLR